MKLNISHLLTIAGIIFLLQTVVVANEWIPLNDQSPGEVVFELAGETPDSLELSTMVNGFWKQETRVDTLEMQQLFFHKSKMTTQGDGQPELPVLRTMIALPATGTVTAELIAGDTMTFSNYHIYPHQPDYLESEPQPPFQLDEETYSTDAWFPLNSVSVDTPGGGGKYGSC